MASMEEVKKAANPMSMLTDEIKLTNESLDTLIILLGALCDSNDAIVRYKEEQKQGDIRFRKKTAVWSVVSIAIALAAFVSAGSIDSIINIFKV